MPLKKNFHLNIEVNVIFPGRVDYSSRDVMDMYSDAEKLVKSNKHFTSRTISWLSEYRSWATKRNIDINDTGTFYQNLQNFISLPGI